MIIKKGQRTSNTMKNSIDREEKSLFINNSSPKNIVNHKPIYEKKLEKNKLSVHDFD